MKRLAAILSIVALAALYAPSPTAAAEAEGPNDTAAPAAPAVDEYLGWLQQQMRRMDALLQQVRSSASPEQRRERMHEYAVALEVTNALTRAVDPHVGAPAAPAKEMCAMMKGKDVGTAGDGGAGADAAAAPSGHEGHH